MNQSPRQARPSLGQGRGYQYNDISLERYDNQETSSVPLNHCFDHSARMHRNTGAIDARSDLQGPRRANANMNANAFGQYHTSNLDLDAGGIILHNRQASERPLLFATDNDQDLLRGIEKFNANTGLDTQNREAQRNDAMIPYETPSLYNMPCRSIELANGSPALTPMQTLQPGNHDTSPQGFTPVRQTKYEPFQCRFADSAQARDYRRVETRFGRMPYYDPDIDTTIAAIENNRQRNVERIYNAMTSGESAKDNRGSIAMKRWVLDAHYPPNLVEAYAHKVFDCLLAQAKDGFRGWVHNDYVADERKGEDIDKDVDCAGRLDNIVQALEHEKTICEDVMNSACQIRMFVNAPRAYANRKHQNRVGNSKRGRTKDISDTNSKPVKAARTGGRRTRARSSTMSDMPSLRGTTPQYQQTFQPVSLPYFSTPPPHQGLVPSPSISVHSVPRPTPPLHRPGFASSFGHFTNTATSPSAASSRTLRTPQMHTTSKFTTPADQVMLRMSPQPHSYGDNSAPKKLDDAKSPLTNTGPALWCENGLFNQSESSPHQQSSISVDPMLAQWNFRSLTPGEQPNTNMFDGTSADATCSLVDLEHQQARQSGGLQNEDIFQSFWDHQLGVQQFPHQP